MTDRTRTRLMVGIGAALTFAAHQLPDSTPEWVAVLIGAANAGIVGWLGMREPGRTPGGVP